VSTIPANSASFITQYAFFTHPSNALLPGQRMQFQQVTNPSLSGTYLA